MTRIKSLSGSQTSPVVLCMQNSVISTRITSLHGSQTSPVVLCMLNNVISIRITSLYCSQTSFVVFACKTRLSFCACNSAWLAPELLVSMGPSTHLWILNAKQHLLVQHTSLYGCQTSPVVLCMQNRVISTRITRLHGFQPSSVVLCIQNSHLRKKNCKSVRVPDFTCDFLHAKQHA